MEELRIKAKVLIDGYENHEDTEVFLWECSNTDTLEDRKVAVMALYMYLIEGYRAE